MSTPDRHPVSGQFTQQDQGAEDTRTHQGELMASHAPSVAEQAVTHGVGVPAVDLGPVLGSVVGATPGEVIGGAP